MQLHIFLPNKLKTISLKILIEGISLRVFQTGMNSSLIPDKSIINIPFNQEYIMTL